MQQVVLNYWAVAVAAVSTMVIGSLWYGPLLFGKRWMKLAGVTSMGKHPAKSMLGGFVSALVMSYVVGNFVVLLKVKDVAGAAQFAAWVWLGLIATVQIGSVLWEGKSVKLFFLNAAQSLIALFAMVVILAYWR